MIEAGTIQLHRLAKIVHRAGLITFFPKNFQGGLHSFGFVEFFGAADFVDLRIDHGDNIVLNSTKYQEDFLSINEDNRKRSQEMGAEIGSQPWSQQTKGLMSFKDKVEFARLLFISEAKQAFEKTPFFRSKLASMQKRVDLNQLAIPNSKVCQEALAKAQEEYVPALKLHCLRTYFWGCLLAQSDQRKVDFELFFVSSILHDLGISQKHLCKAQNSCFAVNGAEEVLSWLQAFDLKEEERKLVYQAISAHLNPHLNVNRFGLEAYYLSQGAAMDVIGAHSHRIPGPVIQQVLKAYPRTQFVEAILETMDIGHAKSSRADFLMKIGFPKLAKNCKLDH